MKLREIMLEDKAKVELILKGLNISKDFRFLDNSLDIQLMDIYEKIIGAKALEKAIAFEGSPKPFQGNWSRLLESELAKAVYSNNYIIGIIDRVEESITRNWLWIFAISKSIDEGDLNLAEIIIDKLPEEGEVIGPLKSQGHRLILKYYASQGDLESFYKRLKHCNVKRQSHIRLY
ncbi:MAG: hypothetical protein QMB24_17815 [Spirosomataceae bacterium]